MNVYDTQVWQGEKWIGFFLNPTIAGAWVAKQEDPASYIINNVGPREKS